MRSLNLSSICFNSYADFRDFTLIFGCSTSSVWLKKNSCIGLTRFELRGVFIKLRFGEYSLSKLGFC